MELQQDELDRIKAEETARWEVRKALGQAGKACGHGDGGGNSNGHKHGCCGGGHGHSGGGDYHGGGSRRRGFCAGLLAGMVLALLLGLLCHHHGWCHGGERGCAWGNRPMEGMMMQGGDGMMQPGMGGMMMHPGAKPAPAAKP